MGIKWKGKERKEGRKNEQKPDHCNMKKNPKLQELMRVYS